jgi:hypothetical protein
MKNSLPASVEKTIKKVLDFFANSHVRADKLEEIADKYVPNGFDKDKLKE